MKNKKIFPLLFYATAFCSASYSQDIDKALRMQSESSRSSFSVDVETMNKAKNSVFDAENRVSENTRKDRVGLYESLSLPSHCTAVKDKCLVYCKQLSDKGFSSVRDDCKSDCISAALDCKSGDSNQVNRKMCSAQCRGFSTDNGGVFTSSSYEKCTSKCTNGY